MSALRPLQGAVQIVMVVSHKSCTGIGAPGMPCLNMASMLPFCLNFKLLLYECAIPCAAMASQMS